MVSSRIEFLQKFISYMKNFIQFTSEWTVRSSLYRDYTSD